MRKDVFNISRSVPLQLGKTFDALARRYCHKKQQYVPLSAAMLMFIEADPTVQKEFVKRILAIEVDRTAGELIAEAKAEQAAKIEARERDSPSKRKGSRGSDNPASGAA